MRAVRWCCPAWSIRTATLADPDARNLRELDAERLLQRHAAGHLARLLGLGYARFASNLPINESGAMPIALAYTVRDALEWATINGAEACGLDAEIGSITPGKQADIIVVGNGSFAMRPMHEPLGSIVFQATTRDVGTVLIAGKIMKQAGKLTGVDSDRLAAQAESAAGEILDRVRESGATLPTVPH